MNSKELADKLLKAYDMLNWHIYVELTDTLVKIDEKDIPGELLIQATIYSHYAGLLVLSKEDMEKAVTKVMQFYAFHKNEYRKSCKEAGSRATDKGAEAYVEGLPEFHEINYQSISAKKKHGLLKALVASLEMRKDMLLQLSANSRQEAKLYQ